MTDDSLKLSPIGFLRSTMQLKFDSPHQPDSSVGQTHQIELLPGHGFDRALRDLTGFERIWLISWFHRNSTWRPLVLPPRGPALRRGVFATRSPHRPNPLGLTSVKLISIKDLTLTIGDCDLIDGTPIIDIKPYIPGVDSFPEAHFGWLEAVEKEYLGPAQFKVTLSNVATEQFEWLKANCRTDFFTRVLDILARNPHHHRTRRITRPKEGVSRMSCGAWRVYFVINGQDVVIQKFEPGYPKRLLVNETLDDIPYRAAQLGFSLVFKV